MHPLKCSAIKRWGHTTQGGFNSARGHSSDPMIESRELAIKVSPKNTECIAGLPPGGPPGGGVSLLRSDKLRMLAMSSCDASKRVGKIQVF